MQVTPGGTGNVMAPEGQELQLSPVGSTLTWPQCGTEEARPGSLRPPPQQLPGPRKGTSGLEAPPPARAWAPLRTGWVHGGHPSTWPGLLHFHPPLPLGASVSCRLPAARPGFHPTPPNLCWGVSAPRARARGAMALEGLPTLRPPRTAWVEAKVEGLSAGSELLCVAPEGQETCFQHTRWPGRPPQEG